MRTIKIWVLILSLCIMNVNIWAKVKVSNASVDKHQSLEKIQEQILDPKIAKSLLTPRQFETYEDSLSLLKEGQQKKLTIFYLTTQSVFLGAKRFNASVSKLNQRGEEVEGKIVFRGFPKDMTTFIRNVYQEGTKGKIKIYPKIFSTLHVNRVPAYVLSYCPVGENFSFKECDNKFVATGDITLSDFFSIVSDYDKDYAKYYFTLIRPE
ncbi:TrbC family F-type conjugative pilus assembly protein [Helicobacter sp. 13S00477-4]|uniref:TrbC family F-type conjugative pilus assembly protein n=1 Tax=Helicobacter sp. 13S00477-4 TaxID=1905759 RepID=UPI000BA6AE27|nr:TrbC family F-type conjugative pilus assembly protein [Helicobacter sp. 13S00477-4]PAF50650.1 hypothetical protein BKH44_07345 [Helicobacter sp. 13S00477-4]